MRRALAIQLIINREWGLAMNENPLQGSYVIDELTDLVEEAVLKEFDAINERGGVLGAMETGYQRGRIQDESMLYEHRKHDGSLPIIGVNTFRRPGGDDGTPDHVELARATTPRRSRSCTGSTQFQKEHEQEATAALARLKEVAFDGENVFAALMDAARVCSLGQVTEAFFEVGGAVPAECLRPSPGLTVHVTQCSCTTPVFEHPSRGRNTELHATGRARGEPRSLDHRGPRVRTPRGGGGRDRLVHAPGRP